MVTTVGVLALQGGVAEHERVLRSAGARVRLVRRRDDLEGLDALVLPGGESSTMGRLLTTFGLLRPLADAAASGMPVLGTCAGLVLLARTVLDPAPGQATLGVLDVVVRRNAFGPQLDSAEVHLDTALGPVHVAFIRAPDVVSVGAGVEVLARYRGRVVAVRQGPVTGLAFHPELTGDPTFHTKLLRQVATSRRWAPARLHSA
ncbi:MAG: pyridoxal 5'-phosphate synthase glutaminase subunit PdxT [Actinomycetes bacterium]